MLVDQDISAVEGIGNKQMWIPMTVSRKQASYLQSLSSSVTYRRADPEVEIPASAGLRPASVAPVAESKMSPTSRSRKEVLTACSSCGRSFTAEELRSHAGKCFQEAELRASLEASNESLKNVIPIRHSGLFYNFHFHLQKALHVLKEHNQRQMERNLEKAIDLFDKQMYLDNTALTLIKRCAASIYFYDFSGLTLNKFARIRVFDVSPSNYDARYLKELDADITDLLHRYTEVKAQAGPGIAQVETRAAEFLKDAQEKVCIGTSVGANGCANPGVIVTVCSLLRSGQY